MGPIGASNRQHGGPSQHDDPTESFRGGGQHRHLRLKMFHRNGLHSHSSYPPQVKLFECRMEKLLQLLRHIDMMMSLRVSSDLLKVDVNGLNTTPPLRLHRARRAELVSIDSEAVRQVFTFAMSPLSLPVLLFMLEPCLFSKH